MKIDDLQKQHLEELYQRYLNDEKVLRMKEVPMHRGSNCYLHSFRVAKVAIKHALTKRKDVDLEVLLLAAILHDYYLYDWRKDKTKKRHHGSRHPFIAAKQAKEDFDVDEKVQTVIQSHMWPINIKCFPSTMEAKILSFADKKIATMEAATSKSHKSKKYEEYYKNISKLFDD